MLKRFTTLGARASIVLLAAGLLQPGGAAPASGSTTGTPEPPVTLRLWDWSMGTRAVTIDQKIRSELNERFFHEHPHIRPGNTTRLRIPNSGRDGSLMMAFAGGTAPHVISFPIYQSQTLIDQGFLEPLDSYIARAEQSGESMLASIPDRILPVVQRYDTERKGTATYALPLAYGVKGIVYREDLFRDVGLDPDRPPTTWDELLEYGVRLTRPASVGPDGATVAKRYGLWTLVPHDTFMLFTWQCGGDMVHQFKLCPACGSRTEGPKETPLLRCGNCGADLDAVPSAWRVVWASAAGEKALAYIRDLVWQPWIRFPSANGSPRTTLLDYDAVAQESTITLPDGMQLDLADPDVQQRIERGCLYVRPSSTSLQDIFRMFARGEVAMMMIPMTEEFLSAMESEGVPFHLVRFMSMPAPEGGRPVTHMQAGMIGINSQATAAEKEAAWEYIRYVSGDRAWEAKTRGLVQRGMGFLVRPRMLQRFGYDHLYAQVDPNVIEVYDTLNDHARAMPWNEGWLSICSSILSEALETITQPGGWTRDVGEVLTDYQDFANSTVLTERDEQVYRRVRPWAWLGLGLAAAGFAAALVTIGRLRTRGGGAGATGALRSAWMAWVFLLPAVASVLLWRYVPLGWGGGMAFFDYRLLDGFASPFVGVDNFIDIFRQPLFYRVMLTTLYYVGLSLALGFVVPIVLALLLDECPRGSLAFRIIFYLPAMMSPLVTMMLWQQFYEPTSQGLLNQLLVSAGLIDPQHPLRFLNDPRLAMLCVIIPGIWAHAGPGCIIYLAALKVVPADLYEAIAVDGGGVRHKLRLVTLPALRPLIVINFIGAFIGAWQAMQNIFVMTGGGPLNATRVIGIEIWFNAFVYLRFGYATAMGWILASLLVGFTVVQIRFFSRVEFQTQAGN